VIGCSPAWSAACPHVSVVFGDCPTDQKTFRSPTHIAAPSSDSAVKV
jgi:hypothetical protein